MDGVNRDALEKVRLRTQEALEGILQLKVNLKPEDSRVISIYNEINGSGIDTVSDDEMRRYAKRYFLS